MIHEIVLTTGMCTVRGFWVKSIFCEMAVLRASEDLPLEKYLMWWDWRERRVSTLLISCRNIALLSLLSSERRREGCVACEVVVLMRWLRLRTLIFSFMVCLERIQYIIQLEFIGTGSYKLPFPLPPTTTIPPITNPLKFGATVGWIGIFWR